MCKVFEREALGLDLHAAGVQSLRTRDFRAEPPCGELSNFGLGGGLCEVCLSTVVSRLESGFDDLLAGRRSCGLRDLSRDW
jgi:hypothetical protein